MADIDAPLAWRMQQDGYLMQINQLRDENAKLREELEQWHRLTAGIELPEYPITEFKPKDLERENAKLRELCKTLHRLADESYVPFEDVNPWIDDFAKATCAMHELGIEV